MKTVFVTLLMIGIAMGQDFPAATTSGCLQDAKTGMMTRPTPKPAKPPAKKVDQHEANYKLFDAGYAYGRVSALTLLINSGSNTEELCSELKGADWWADLAKKSGFNESLLEGHEGVDSAREYCRERMPIGDISNGTPLPYIPASSLLHPPLDVPAIRKTHKRHDDPIWTAECLWALQNGLDSLISKCEELVTYWDCADRDAYSLQISVSGKAANCHRIAP